MSEDQKLPCDVFLPPATIIRKGCDLHTLMVALDERTKWAAEDCRFNDAASSIRELFSIPSAAPVMQSIAPIAVTVTGEDYSYEGTLVGVITKSNGKVRYVVEERGRLFVQSAKQLGREEGWRP